MVVDSSVWIEIFLEGPLGNRCERELQNNGTIWIPALVLYEVYRKIKSKASEEAALQTSSFLSQYSICELSKEVALLAGDLSIELKLGMADSIVLAHARHLKETLLTLDNDFADLSDAKVLRQSPPGID